MSDEKPEPLSYKFQKVHDTMAGLWQVQVWTPNGDDYVLYGHQQEEIVDRVATIVTHAFASGVIAAEKLLHLNLMWKFQAWAAEHPSVGRETSLAFERWLCEHATIDREFFIKPTSKKY